MNLSFRGGLNPVTFSRNEPARKAGTYTQVWGGAVWGPHSPAIPPAVLGRRLTILLESPLCRAQPSSDKTKCTMTNTKGSIKLFKGKTLVAKYPAPNSRFGVSVPIASSAALYRMLIQMDRKAGAGLASRMIGDWTFRASGTTKLSRPVLGMPRLDVPGLDVSNAAAVGSTSAISIAVDGWKKATGLVVESSFDGGKTWRKASAKKGSGNQWTASVSNPAQPGYVTLRVRAKDGSGQTFVVTYSNAYRVH